MSNAFSAGRGKRRQLLVTAPGTTKVSLASGRTNIDDWILVLYDVDLSMQHNVSIVTHLLVTESDLIHFYVLTAAEIFQKNIECRVKRMQKCTHKAALIKPYGL